MNAGPNRVEGLEPVEEIGILSGRDGAREGLIKVMVRVDETGHDDMACEIKDFVGNLGQTASWPYILDEAIFNEKTTIREFGLVVVHGEEVGVFD